MESSQSKTMGATVGAAVVALVIGLVIGYGVWHKKDNAVTNNNSGTTISASTKAADLRANLVSLGVQHQDLTTQAIDSTLDGSPNAEAATADLIKNGQDISAAVGSVYGQGAQDKFQAIWNVHLNAFVKYAVASKGGDEAGKAAALKDINDNYTKPISMLLSGANPNLPEKTLENAFGEHIDMTAQGIDDHVAGKFTDETALRAQSADHIKVIMSLLAGAIVKQYPSKFQG